MYIVSIEKGVEKGVVFVDFMIQKIKKFWDFFAPFVQLIYSFYNLSTQ